MNCPRCRLSMESQPYEGREIQLCPGCWGCWVTGDDLRKILADESTKWSQGEKQTIFRTFMEKGDADRQGKERAPISCPTCSGTMAKKKIDESCPVVIDCCADHGYWLDTGELKELQIFIENQG